MAVGGRLEEGPNGHAELPLVKPHPSASSRQVTVALGTDEGCNVVTVVGPTFWRWSCGWHRLFCCIFHLSSPPFPPPLHDLLPALFSSRPRPAP